MRCIAVAVLAVALAACGPSEQGARQQAASPQPEAPNIEELQHEIAELPAPYNEASYDAGRRVFAQCRSCHVVAEDAPHRVGPNLHEVFGREVGTAEGFNYSNALQEADFVWDADHLDHWLANPQTFLPGNRMAFAGVRNETQRRDLIAYLMVEAESDDD